MTDKIGLHDAQGNLVRSWHAIHNALPTEDEHGVPLARNVDLTYNIDVAELFVKHEEIGLVPLKAARIIYKIIEQKRVTHIEDDKNTRYIMRDASTGDVQHFYVEGSSIKTGPKLQS